MKNDDTQTDINHLYYKLHWLQATVELKKTQKQGIATKTTKRKTEKYEAMKTNSIFTQHTQDQILRIRDSQTLN